MTRFRSTTDGDVFHQPRKQPHGRRNPMCDPLALPGARRVREFEPVDVREIRRQFHQTRPQFAEMIGISPETLRNWERGRRNPRGPSRALLRIAAADPDVVAAVLVRNRVTWGRADPPNEP